MKDILVTSGFPRSGNTYLNHALNLLYYPEEYVNKRYHSVVTIEKTSKIIVPIRNPIDCLSSWNKYLSDGSLQDDVLYYKRFHTGVLNNLHKVVLMNFEQFTTDIEYIKNIVLLHFGLTPLSNVTDLEIRNQIVSYGQEISLPRDNQDITSSIKNTLLTIYDFEECLTIYNELFSIACNTTLYRR